MNARFALPLLLGLTALPALAHHGVAGVGAAALEGPGAPVESASSVTLPAGRTLLSLKLIPGVRLYKDNMSFAFGVKLPVSARLNEQFGQRQQGAEGAETWRAIFSASLLF